jgi:UrcA family protein
MRTSILIIAALTALSASPVLAQQSARQEIRTADLDLDSPAGLARFERRVAAALETVCGSYASASAQESAEIDRCRAAARARVNTRLAALRSRGRPQLVSR